MGHVVRAVEAGLTKYFPGRRAVLVNSDGGSSDGTTDVVREANVDFDSVLLDHRIGGFHKLVTPYHGIPGKGSAFRTVFEIARELKAKACAVVDSDLRSITPEWIELLVKPVLEEGYDYVAPYYMRHKYDGTDHQHDRLPADQGPLRQADPPADRRRFRLLGPARRRSISTRTSGKATSPASASTSG
ncbi:MAG: hypothetical protein M0C28_14195 [Candidatus Moduliflexus flocculans]|nr:hypothetical protein [Candidatus Moduliflexus flocculans]